jgi:hypothetical protein
MKILKLILFLLLGSILLSATETDTFYTNGQFLCSGIGSGFGSFKDVGTSPLTYQGISAIVPSGFLLEKAKYNFELNTTLSYLGGSAANNYTLQYFSGKLNVSYLRSIPLFTTAKLKFQAGARLSTGLSGIYNPSYQNASFNMDYYASLYAGAKLVYLFERSQKDIKFSFLKFHLPHRQYAVHFRLDLPVLLFNGRPTFPFVYENVMDIFNRHYFLGGFHIKSNFGIKRYLKNGNAIEISYIWDMLTTGSKDLYLLETASHNLLMSFYFKLD